MGEGINALTAPKISHGRQMDGALRLIVGFTAGKHHHHYLIDNQWGVDLVKRLSAIYDAGSRAPL